MNGWITACVVVVTVEIVLQTSILAGAYYGLRQANRKMHHAIDELQSKLDPILFRVTHLLEKSEAKIIETMKDVAGKTRRARERTQTINRIVSEATERVRLQFLPVDEMLTVALETVEGIRGRMRRSALGPSPEASARARSIRTGIDFSRCESVPRGQPARDEKPSIYHSASAGLSSESPMENDLNHSPECSTVSRSDDSWSEPRPQNIPRPTYSPAVLALAIVCLLWGIVTTYLISVLGMILFVVGLAGWIGELLHEHEVK
ncbi:MAG: hypothetical protein WA876_13220 [Candidatus Acidiferrales bacterium]